MALTEYGSGRSLRALVDLERGANLVSLRTADGLEVLAAGTDPDTHVDDRDFSRAGLRGYDDCFPTIASGEVAAFAGRALDDHGDAWYRRWESVTQTSSDATASFQDACSLDDLGFRITRLVELDEYAAHFTVQLQNLTDQRLPFIWAGHLLLAVESGDRLVLDNPTVVFEVNNLKIGHRDESQLDAVWPLNEYGEFAWDDLPSGAYAKAFAPWPDAGATLRRGDYLVRVESTGQSRPDHIGLWVNAGGFPEHAPLSHIGVEPTLGDTDSLAEAVSTGTSRWLAPGQTRDVNFAITVTAAE